MPATERAQRLVVKCAAAPAKVIGGEVELLVRLLCSAAVGVAEGAKVSKLVDKMGVVSAAAAVVSAAGGGGMVVNTGGAIVS